MQNCAILLLIFLNDFKVLIWYRWFYAMNNSNHPLFSIVIPTYNRRDSLQHTVENLARQIYPNFEVVVVIDGGKDDSASMLAALAPQMPFPLRYIEQANAGPAKARNTGAEAAQGQYLLFMDDDIEALPELVEEHWRSHSQQENLIVIGTTPAPPGETGSAWFKYDAMTLEKHYKKVRSGEWKAGPRMFYTGNVSLTKADFWRVGGFDTTLRRGEDIELGYRLADIGLNFILNEKACGWHLSEARSMEGWLKIAYTYGLVDARMDLLRNRYGMLASIGVDYLERNRLLRAMVKFCLDQPSRSKVALKSLAVIANLNKGKVSQFACSAMFNLKYYQGIVDGGGAAEYFWASTDPAMLNRYNQRHIVKSSAELPGISLIVKPSQDGAGLFECLENLLSSNYPNFEIIVAGPIPQTFFAEDRRVTYLDSTEVLPQAHHDLIAFIGENYRPNSDWLETVGQTFANRPEVAIVSNTFLGANDPVWTAPVTEWEHSRYWGATKLKELDQHPNLAVVARREVYAKTGEINLPFNNPEFCLKAAEMQFIHLHQLAPGGRIAAKAAVRKSVVTLG